MNRERELIKNTVILAIGTISSKLFTFLLLPLYTAALTTEDYGTVDLIMSLIFLIVPIVTLQLSTSVFRYIIEYKNSDQRKKVVTTSNIIVILNTLVFCIIIFILNILFNFKYSTLFILSFISNCLATQVLSIARGYGRNDIYSIASFLVTITSLILNIILILGFGVKGNSILIAYAISNYVAVIFITIKMKLWKDIKFKYFDIDILKEMLDYSIPMIPNSIAWWIANTSNKFIITLFLGASSNGIYAIANKIPTIYTTIFNVYNMAWGESIARYIYDDDASKYINGVFKKSFNILCLVLLMLINMMSIFFERIIGSNYMLAYDQIYILTIAIFINSLCSLYGGIFAGFKESKIIGKTTTYGAVLDLVLNICLVKFMGIYAASISTLVAYVAIFVVRKIESDKLIKINYPKKETLLFICMLFITTIGYFKKNIYINCMICIILLVWGVVINIDLIKGLLISLKKNLTKKNIVSN